MYHDNIFFQIEDRIKKLFSAWSAWSIFPPLYLNGLHAAFYMTESEFLQLQLSIAQQPKTEMDNDEEQMDSLRRRARAAGVAVSPSSSAAELLCKLDFSEKYLKRTMSGGFDPSIPALLGLPRGASALSRAAAAEEAEDEEGRDLDGVALDGDDIDGVPLDEGFSLRPTAFVPVSAAASSSSAGSFYQIPSASNPSQEDDDIDGVPMDALPETGRSEDAYDDDLDGVPMDDIDGVELPPEKEKGEESDEDSMEGRRQGHGGRRKGQKELEAKLLQIRDQLEARGAPEEEVAAVLREIRSREASGN